MFYVKVVDLLSTYKMPFGVCRSDVWFLRSEGGPKRPPAQNRTFQSPPGIGLTYAHSRARPVPSLTSPGCDMSPTATMPVRRLLNIERPSRLESRTSNLDLCSHHTETNTTD